MPPWRKQHHKRRRLRDARVGDCFRRDYERRVERLRLLQRARCGRAGLGIEGGRLDVITQAASDEGGDGRGEVSPLVLAVEGRICEDVRSFSHGTVFRSARRPDYWEYNCIRLVRPMPAAEMIAAADRELVGCAHRMVEWMIPMPDCVVGSCGSGGGSLTH